MTMLHGPGTHGRGLDPILIRDGSISDRNPLIEMWTRDMLASLEVAR